MDEDDVEDTSAQPAAPTRPGDRLASSTLGALRRGGRPDRQPGAAAAAPDNVFPDPPKDDAGFAADDLVIIDLTKAPVEASTDDETPSEAHVASPEADKKADERDAPTGRRVSRWTAVCAVVAFAALVFAVVTGVGWWTSGHSSERRVGLARDAIIDDATNAIVTVNTSDYREPTAALDNWLTVSTGSLHSQFAQSRSAAAKLLGEAKMITKATVLDAAVTDVNLSKGVASVIASVNVTRTPVTGSVTTVRNRFRATLARVGGQWKLSDLSVVPVSLS